MQKLDVVLVAPDDEWSKVLSERSKVLSPREREVGLLVAQGLTNKEAAVQLGVSTGTVKLHVQNILQKLGANSRHRLIALRTSG